MTHTDLDMLSRESKGPLHELKYIVRMSIDDICLDVDKCQDVSTVITSDA